MISMKYINLLNRIKTSNAVKVLISSSISLIILLNVRNFISILQLDEDKLISTNAFWTLFTLIVSSPIAFIIWYFRDKNSSYQIEKTRTLKSFKNLQNGLVGTILLKIKLL